MATKKGKARKTSRRAYSPKRRHAKSKPKIHIIPDLIEVAAAGELLIPAAENMYNDYQAGGIQQAFSGGNMSYNVKNLMLPQVIPAVELGAVGFIVKWAAKKLGISNIGTKELKVF